MGNSDLTPWNCLANVNTFHRFLTFPSKSHRERSIISDDNKVAPNSKRPKNLSLQRQFDIFLARIRHDTQKPGGVRLRYFSGLLGVKCADGTFYTGYTPDMKRRIKLHNDGRGAKYTRDKRPVKLVWCKEYRYFKRAFKKEMQLKKLTHREKRELVKIYERTR